MNILPVNHRRLNKQPSQPQVHEHTSSESAANVSTRNLLNHRYMNMKDIRVPEAARPAPQTHHTAAERPQSSRSYSRETSEFQKLQHIDLRVPEATADRPHEFQKLQQIDLTSSRSYSRKTSELQKLHGLLQRPATLLQEFSKLQLVIHGKHVLHYLQFVVKLLVSSRHAVILNSKHGRSRMSSSGGGGCPPVNSRWSSSAAGRIHVSAQVGGEGG